MLTARPATRKTYNDSSRLAATGQGAAPRADFRPHAVVIGSGFGGLAAAVRLGARGYRVTVLEALDAPGGRAYVHRQDGFVFDAGPTVITAPFLFEELWALAGRRMSDDIDLRPVSPFYRVVFDDGEHFEYTGDAAAMRAEVHRLVKDSTPGDVDGYQRFLAASEAIYRVGFEELGDEPFGAWTDMAKVLPDLVRLEAYRTVWSLACKHVADPRLRVVLTFQSLLVGGNPFATTSVYCLIAFLERQWGVHFPIGGTGSFVRGLVGLIEGQGGRVRLNAKVAQITVADGAASGVRLADGETVAADVVVSNCDSAWTYKHLLAPEHRHRWTDRRIGARALFDESLRLVFRHAATGWASLRRRRASHDPARPALSRTARRHLRSQAAGRGFQPLPASAHGDRSVARARRLRHVLRAVAGAASGRAASTGEVTGERISSTAIEARLEETAAAGARRGGGQRRA